MILSFSEDRFKERILGGVKIHTIRTDRTERWKKGQKIHFWRGNPRNTKATPKPHEFHTGNCSSVQKIEMKWGEDTVYDLEVIVDNRQLTQVEVEEIALADGFDDAQQMYEWFTDNVETNSFKGRLIHWTKKLY